MYCVYFLKNLKNNDLYIGSCENVKIRLARNNSGNVKSTKGYRPWHLVGMEKCESRSEAVKKEKFYKTSQQKVILKRRYN